MKTKLFILCLVVMIFLSCKQDYSISKIEGKRLEINDSIKTDNAIDMFIEPYRDIVNKDLDSTLAYAADTYSKTDGELNTAIGNFMADALYDMANPVFKSRTGKDIDLVLLNHGGIRSIISKGNITSRTAYEVMPFDNTVVVTTLNGQQVKKILNFLASRKRAHPIAGLQLILNADGSINKALIKNSKIDYYKTYYVATSDYLYNGGDRMSFLKSKDSLYDLDYKIRNLLIDYFKKIDTLQPIIDDRFIQLKDS